MTNTEIHVNSPYAAPGLENDDTVPYVVLYWEQSALAADSPKAFQCKAEDLNDAEAIFETQYPGCNIAWVFAGNNVEEAYQDYFSAAEDEGSLSHAHRQ